MSRLPETYTFYNANYPQSQRKLEDGGVMSGDVSAYMGERGRKGER